MRILNWLKSWFITSSVSRQLSGACRRLDTAEKASKRALRRLDRQEESLAKESAKAQTAVQGARQTNVRMESALEEAREKIQVLEQTINTLVASHKLLMERYDTETSLQVRLRVAASQRE